MCWVALDRGARLADRIGDETPRAVDRSRRRDPSRHPRARVKDAASSASTTTPTRSTPRPPDPAGPLPAADDERVVNTVKAIDEELTEDGLVLRYRVDETDDGLQGEEATFTICSFWLVSALSEIGERKRARGLRAAAAAPARSGLYAEELDATTGRHWGNFPQAFTHLALINAVSHVISDDRVDRRP